MASIWSAAAWRRFGIARSANFPLGALRALTKRRQVAALQGGAHVLAFWIFAPEYDMKSEMSEQRQAITPKALWVLVLVGPLIIAIDLQVKFILVRHGCSAQRTLALYGVTLLAVVLTISSIMVGHRIWRRTRVSWPGDAEDLARVTFVAILGMLSSVMSLHIMIAHFIPIVVFDPCQF